MRGVSVLWGRYRERCSPHLGLLLGVITKGLFGPCFWGHLGRRDTVVPSGGSFGVTGAAVPVFGATLGYSEGRCSPCFGVIIKSIAVPLLGVIWGYSEGIQRSPFWGDLRSHLGSHFGVILGQSEGTFWSLFWVTLGSR